ncbi:hypothetical protein GobsT_28380 [Gemmata obscuriglobus]|nr:hypothetical protein GobsT_28380 [Gemmata obscuriglobus]VTS05660.1 unnamed protein product [Gemmata obscuriglobus UQM 2246]
MRGGDDLPRLFDLTPALIVAREEGSQDIRYCVPKHPSVSNIYGVDNNAENKRCRVRYLVKFQSSATVGGISFPQPLAFSVQRGACVPINGRPFNPVPSHYKNTIKTRRSRLGKSRAAQCYRPIEAFRHEREFTLGERFTRGH